MIPERYRNDSENLELLTISQDERNILFELFARTTEKNIEYGQGIANGVATKVFTSGEKNKVQIPNDILTLPNLHLLHSHTNETPLSGEDFGLLVRYNVERISVVSKNRDVFSVWIGSGEHPSQEGFKEAVGLIRREVDYEVLDFPERLSWTVEQLNYAAVREQAFRIARYFGWHLEGGKL